MKAPIDQRIKLEGLLIALAMVMALSCEKEIGADVSQPANNQTTANTAPIVSAGPDVTIKIMQPKEGSTFLWGTAIDKENNIASYLWQKISGPTGGVIADKDKPNTVISSLDTGVYQFRLVVADQGGLMGMDTVQLTVQKMEDQPDIVLVKEGELLVKNLRWIYPWYASLEVKNIYGLVPASRPFKVFVQRQNSPEWILAPTISISNDPQLMYESFVETRLPDGAGMYTSGSLYIFYYGKDYSEPVTVKITY